MSDTRCAPRMIDLRLAPAAAATWAVTWWATGHPAQWAWIGACTLAALGCAASYALSQRGRNTPRHALTPPRSARLGATILVLGTILILVGPDPSVVRSVCVAAVAALGLILGREGQSIAALCAVVIATLLIDPWSSRSYGFALSALAALAVVGPSAALVRRCRRRIRGDTRAGKILRRLVEMVCVPAFAELATAPLIVSLSGNVPVWGIAANVIAEPAVPVATVAGLAGALISPLSMRVASACAVVASWATAWIAGAARMCASLPGTGVHVPGGSSTVLGVYACCGGGWVAWRAWKRWGAPIVDERGP